MTCNHDGSCGSCKNNIAFVGCSNLSTTKRLSKEAMSQISEMIKAHFEKIENQVNVRIAEQNRPPLAKAISKAIREEHCERDF